MTLPYGMVFLDFGQEKQTSTSNFSGVPLGTKALLPDGRTFRYAFSGEAIGAGELVMRAAPDADHDQDNVVVTAATDVRTITVSAASNNAQAADFFRDGYIGINDGAGEGHLYHIQGHAAFTSATVSYAFRVGEDVVREALASGTTLAGWMKNTFLDCEVFDSSAVEAPLGVAPTEVANDTYFWLQTAGLSMVKVESSGGAPVVGKGLAPAIGDTDTDGGIEGYEPNASSTAADLNNPVIGIATQAVGVDTDYQWTLLKLE